MEAILEGAIVNNMVDPAPGRKMMYPVVCTKKCVLVFTDASGFTAMTEKLSKEPSGAEELGGFLNKFFGILINIVRDWGGDILKFSGDAVTILWPADTPELIVSAPIQAAACCQEV